VGAAQLADGLGAATNSHTYTCTYTYYIHLHRTEAGQRSTKSNPRVDGRWVLPLATLLLDAIDSIHVPAVKGTKDTAPSTPTSATTRSFAAHKAVRLTTLVAGLRKGAALSSTRAVPSVNRSTMTNAP